MSKTKEGNKKGSVGRVISYLVGSTAVFAVACIAIPKIGPYISGSINKAANKIRNAKKSDDDWNR